MIDLPFDSIDPERGAPRQVRLHVLRAWTELAGCHRGMYIGLVQGPDGVQVVEPLAVGDDLLVAAAQANDWSAHVHRLLAQPGNEESSAGGQAKAGGPSLLLAHQYGERGLESGAPSALSNVRQDAGLLVVRQGRALEWLTALRYVEEAPLAHDTLRALQRHCGEVRRLLLRTLERESWPTAGAELILIFDRYGSLECCSEGTLVGLQQWPGMKLLEQEIVAKRWRNSARWELVLGRVRVVLRRLVGPGSSAVQATLTQAPAPSLSPSACLTPAQRRVALALVEGSSVPEVARLLDRSPETIRVHLKGIYRRLNVSNRVELCRVLGSVESPVFDDGAPRS